MIEAYQHGKEPIMATHDERQIEELNANIKRLGDGVQSYR